MFTSVAILKAEMNISIVMGPWFPDADAMRAWATGDADDPKVSQLLVQAYLDMDPEIKNPELAAGVATDDAALVASAKDGLSLRMSVAAGKLNV